MKALRKMILKHRRENILDQQIIRSLHSLACSYRKYLIKGQQKFLCFHGGKKTFLQEERKNFEKRLFVKYPFLSPQFGFHLP